MGKTTNITIMARKFFVGGNFKMNGTHDSLSKIGQTLKDTQLDPNTEVVVAPSPLYVLPLQDLLKGSPVKVAAQSAYKGQQGAFTGEVSVWQLAQEKVPWVILGHSERRTIFKETSQEIAEKTSDALSNGLSVIFCVGETLEEREANKTDAVVQAQLEPLVKSNPDWSKIVVAYEPVWAIGTGKVATPQQAQEAHAAIRAYLSKSAGQQVADSTRIIYGGSVAAKNAKEISAGKDIDGFLVGGASLKPEFADIVNVNKA